MNKRRIVMSDSDIVKIVDSNIKKVDYSYHAFKKSGFEDLETFQQSCIGRVIVGALTQVLKTRSIQLDGVIFKPVSVNDLNSRLVCFWRCIKFENNIYVVDQKEVINNPLYHVDEFEARHPKTFYHIKNTLDVPGVADGVYVHIPVGAEDKWIGNLPISYPEFQQINDYEGRIIKNIPVSTPDLPYVPVEYL